MRRGARFGRRGGGGSAPWTPLALGSKLKLWLDERQQNGSPIDSWTNQAVGGVNSPTALTTARPTVGAINALASPVFEPVDDIMTSTSVLSALVSAGGYYGAAIVHLSGVVGVAADAVAFNNNTIIADSGGFWGLHLKDELTGLMRVQAYHWDGAAKVSGISGLTQTDGPILIQWWFDGANITVKVSSTTGAPTAAGNVSTLTGTIRIGTGQVLRLNGKIGMILICNAVTTAAERTAVEGWAARWGATFP